MKNICLFFVFAFLFTANNVTTANAVAPREKILLSASLPDSRLGFHGVSSIYNIQVLPGNYSDEYSLDDESVNSANLYNFLTLDVNNSDPASLTSNVKMGSINLNNTANSITVASFDDAPIAQNQTVTVIEEEATSITLVGTDAEGSPLTYTIISGPVNGVLTGSGANLIYTSNDFGGVSLTDSFTFMVNDGTSNSNIATVFLNLLADNDAPLAYDRNVVTNEDTPVSFRLSGEDKHLEDISFVNITAPAHGTLSGTVPNLTYTPAPNYTGTDSFTFRTFDGIFYSGLATVTITVNPINDAPVAFNQTVLYQLNTPVNFALTAFDVEGSALAYTLLALPANGSISGSAPNLTFTPNASFNGTNTLTFKVNDGTVDSNIATVTFNFDNFSNDPPVAEDQLVTVIEDTNKNITLGASDPDGNLLTYTIVSGPSHGTLSGTGPIISYTPNANYNGPDSFTFKVNDGTVDSNVATVTINVTPVNDAPVTTTEIIIVQEDIPKVITLTAVDVENSPLTFSILTQPTHGTLTGSGNTRTYTPDLNYVGSDEFEFRANDGSLNSNIGTITINVVPVNDAPVAVDNTNITTNEDVAVTFAVIGNDTDIDGFVDGSTVDLDPTTPVEDKSLTVLNQGVYTVDNAGNVTFTPTLNYNGLTTSINYTVKDNSGAVSNVAKIQVNVLPINDAPVANNQSVTVQEDIAEVITLSAVDVENSPLIYSILTQPSHGILTGSGNTWSYTPDLNYTGSDSFTFKVNDGSLDSNVGTITISVVPVNDAPVAVSYTNITTNEDVPVSFSVISNATDVDGIVDGTTVDLDPSTPAEDKTLTVMGQGVYTVNSSGIVTFTPALNYNGLATAINYTVKDNEGALSNVAQIQVNVLPVNDAPVAIDQTVVVVEDIAKVIILSGSDVENSPLTFTILTQPSHGTLSGSGNTWTYTPNLDYIGPDSFTFKVNDGSLDSSPGTVSINVGSVNDPPVAVNDVITTQEDIAVTFNIITNSDTDSDGTINAATVDLDPATIAEEKTITVTGQGTYTVDNAGNVTFTPVLNYNGTATLISYTIKDNIGDLSNVATIQVIVTPVNDAPVVTPITVTINEDEPTKICFTVTDVENDPSVFSGAVSLGGHGTITADPAGAPFCFIYTPDPDYNGPDQVQVTVCDANDATVCSSGVITINILPVNDPPRIVKNGDSVDKVTFTTPEDTPLNFCFDVVDPEGGIVSVGSITNTLGGGTLVQGVGGANQLCFTFNPVQDFNGKTTWSVVLCDDGIPALCGTFTIEINVTPVNDAATAANVSTTTPEDTPVAIVLAGMDVDGDVLTYTIVGSPAHGVISGTGADINYTPEPNYVGNDSFTYKVNDGTGDSNTATVNITVTPVNDAPVISPIPVITTPEDTPIEICVGVTDIDGDQITYQTPVMVSGGGTMTLSSSFDFCYTFTPAKDFNGVAVWKFSVCDNGNPSKCTEVTVQINVTPVNDPPIAVDDMITAMSSTATAANILANDIDVDGDVLTLTTTPLAGPFHGTVTMNANGSITYKSEQGFMGADSIRYKVCDSGTPSLCDEGVVFIEVGPAPFKIYNGFSPNGDGLNEYWRIDGIEAFPNNHVRVFDRYNNMIFEVNGYNNDENSWRGQTNHSLISGNVPEGTYFYSVNLGDGSDLFSGYVVLKKN